MTTLWIRGTCPRCGRLGEVRAAALLELKRCRACAAEDKAVVERIVVGVVKALKKKAKKVVKKKGKV